MSENTVITWQLNTEHGGRNDQPAVSQTVTMTESDVRMDLCWRMDSLLKTEISFCSNWSTWIAKLLGLTVQQTQNNKLTWSPETTNRAFLSSTAEADKPVVEPSAESAAPAPAPAPSPAPSPEESENKPTNSPAPVGQSAEENIDDDGSISNQTSVESLKETNENNSNSVNRGLITGLDMIIKIKKKSPLL